MKVKTNKKPNMLLVDKFEDLSSVSEIHMLKGEKQLHRVVCWPLHTGYVQDTVAVPYKHVHPLSDTITKVIMYFEMKYIS